MQSKICTKYRRRSPCVPLSFGVGKHTTPTLKTAHRRKTPQKTPVFRTIFQGVEVKTFLRFGMQFCIPIFSVCDTILSISHTSFCKMVSE